MSVKNIHPLKKLFDEQGKVVEIHLGRETITDPDEYSKDVTLVPPISAKALLVNELMPSQLQWKLTGQHVTNGEVLIFEAYRRSTIELSQKLVINGLDYYGYKNNVGTNFQIRRLGTDYIQVYTVMKDAS